MHGADQGVCGLIVIQATKYPLRVGRGLSGIDGPCCSDDLLLILSSSRRDFVLRSQRSAWAGSTASRLLPGDDAIRVALVANAPHAHLGPSTLVLAHPSPEHSLSLEVGVSLYLGQPMRHVLVLMLKGCGLFVRVMRRDVVGMN